MFIRNAFEHAVISPANSQLSETVSAWLSKRFLFYHTFRRAFFSAPALCSAVVQSLPCLFVFSFPYQSVTSVTLTWIMLKLPYLFFLCFVFIISCWRIWYQLGYQLTHLAFENVCRLVLLPLALYWYRYWYQPEGLVSLFLLDDCWDHPWKICWARQIRIRPATSSWQS